MSKTLKFWVLVALALFAMLIAYQAVVAVQAGENFLDGLLAAPGQALSAIWNWLTGNSTESAGEEAS